MSEDATLQPAQQVEGEKPEPERAANLAFCSFALLSVNVFVVLTGLYGSGLVLVIPAAALGGLLCAAASADAAGQGRRGRGAALGVLHGLTLIAFLYRLFT